MESVFITDIVDVFTRCVHQVEEMNDNDRVTKNKTPYCQSLGPMMTHGWVTYSLHIKTLHANISDLYL